MTSRPLTARSCRRKRAAGLATLLGQQRTLLILDGLEPLQEPPSSYAAGQLKDRGIREFLKALVADSRGLCLVTSRYKIRDLGSYPNSTKTVELTRLSTEAGSICCAN